MSSLRIYWSYLLGLPKTLRFNFRYLPFGEAVKLPFLLSHQVRFKKLGGEVILTTPPAERKRGMIKLGFSDVGIFDKRLSPVIWQVSGTVVFEGRADLGHGSRLSVAGRLVLGAGFGINAESAIICRKGIRFGRDCLLSWDILIMDTDFHEIHTTAEPTTINPDAEVTIGDEVWIGCRATILKGVTLAKGTIVAAGSNVVTSSTAEQTVIGGNPAKTIKSGVVWRR